MGGDLVNVPEWTEAEPMVPASPDATGPILPQKRDFPTTAAGQFQRVFHRGWVKIILVRATLRRGEVKEREFIRRSAYSI